MSIFGREPRVRPLVPDHALWHDQSVNESGGERDRLHRFYLVRDADVTGVSGTGVIALGVVFEDGTCVLRWTLAANPKAAGASTAVWENVGAMLDIHGHDGRTYISWLDSVEED